MAFTVALIEAAPPTAHEIQRLPLPTTARFEFLAFYRRQTSRLDEEERGRIEFSRRVVRPEPIEARVVYLADLFDAWRIRGRHYKFDTLKPVWSSGYK